MHLSRRWRDGPGLRRRDFASRYVVASTSQSFAIQVLNNSTRQFCNVDYNTPVLLPQQRVRPTRGEFAILAAQEIKKMLVSDAVPPLTGRRELIIFLR